ncbi:hypothetical protein HaLaN_20354 [Haematococcus lacustris]|uniref:Uncharacterized protein n=1 Tax=Haematococcus lacustris TaxID=44745 RepID=A0A699ZVX8_HAELA|nr:hypothetical protein HaLaN_20354 [Haematococcus lacustris]
MACAQPLAAAPDGALLTRACLPWPWPLRTPTRTSHTSRRPPAGGLAGGSEGHWMRGPAACPAAARPAARAHEAGFLVQLPV